MYIDYSIVDVPGIDNNRVLRSLIEYALAKIDSRYLLVSSNPSFDNNSVDKSITPLNHLNLSKPQTDFLCARASGNSIIEAQADLGVAAVELLAWQQNNPLFAACAEILKQADAYQAKAMNIHKATKDPDAFLERAFFVKAVDHSYRDSDQGPKRAQTNVIITLVDGRAERVYDVSASQTDKPGNDDA